MKKSLLVSASCMLCLASQLSLAETKSEFTIPGDSYDDTKHLVTMPENTSAASDNKCQEMAREVEALKGKPQRRYVAKERYEAECLSGQRNY